MSWSPESPPSRVGGSRRVLILNPRAGALSDPGMARSVADTVASELQARILLTRSGEDARAFGRAARLAGAREVVVGGGDGTVSGVVRGLLDVEGESPGGAPPFPTLVLLPLGTGNDLARCLGIPLEWREALELAVHGSPVQRLDLLDVRLDDTALASVNAVVVGSGGRVGEILDPADKERWGPLSYLRSAAEVALELTPMEVDLALDGGEPMALRALNVVAANGRYAARGIPIAPGSSPLDGHMDLVVIREAPLTGLLTMAPALLREVDPEHEAYDHRQVESVRIEAREEALLPVSVDGENQTARRIEVALARARIPVRVPGTGA